MAPSDSSNVANRTDAPGRVIGGKYRIDHAIGGGAFGSVFAATHQWTRRRVALKVLKAEVAFNADVVRRFAMEARIATKLAHPNIVEVLDMGQEPDDGSLYIVQELLSGCDLRKTLEDRRRLPVREALDRLVPIMGALVAAHREGVVHRDVKPENIFLADDKGAVTPKLIDFGISKVRDPESGFEPTHSGVTIGTPSYMSPEQAKGQSDVDGRSDVWAMGAVLFEVLTGAPAFVAEDLHGVYYKILHEDPPRADAVALDVPRDVADVIQSSLARDRDVRVPSMAAMIERLLACSVVRDDPPETSIARRHAGSLPDLKETPRDRGIAFEDTVVAKKAAGSESVRDALRAAWEEEPPTQVVGPKASMAVDPGPPPVAPASEPVRVHRAVSSFALGSNRRSRGALLATGVGLSMIAVGAFAAWRWTRNGSDTNARATPASAAMPAPPTVRPEAASNDAPSATRESDTNSTAADAGALERPSASTARDNDTTHAPAIRRATRPAVTPTRVVAATNEPSVEPRPPVLVAPVAPPDPNPSVASGSDFGLSRRWHGGVDAGSTR